MSEMTESTIQMQKVFPDSPPPPKVSPSVPPAQYRKDDPEESLLGTFIQWVGSSKKKSPKKHNSKGEKTSKFASTPEDDIVGDPQPQEGAEKKEKSRDNKNKNDNKRTRDKAVKVSGSHTNIKVELDNNPAFKNVHLSRPSTPQLTEGYADLKSYDPEGDKYRLMYLSVRIEQQIKHVTNVLKTLIVNKAKVHRIGSMLKVGEALHQFKCQLKGVRHGSKSIMKMFKSMADLQEFFDAIEAVCCSVEGIPVEDPVISDNLKTMIRKEVKETPIEANTRKQQEALERRKLQTEAKNSEEPPAEENAHLKKNKTKGKSKREKGKMKFLVRENEQADGSPSNNYRHQAKEQSLLRENASQHSKKNSLIPRQRDSTAHNILTNVTSAKKDANTNIDTFQSRDTKVNDKQSFQGLSPKSNVTAQAKRVLYKDAKKLQNDGFYPCAEGFDDFEFDSDEEKEKKMAKKKSGVTKLQGLQTIQKQKDDEYDSLMEEIDSLMAETDINLANTTYEELMARKGGGGQRRMHKGRMQDGHINDRTTSQKRSVLKKNAKKSDPFMDSLENLLDECDDI